MFLFLLFVFYSFQLFVIYMSFVVLQARVGERSYNFQINQKLFSAPASKTSGGISTGQILPDQTLLPSCIKLSEANGNNFELKPQFINTLPKFLGLESEDAYFFVRELKKYVS